MKYVLVALKGELPEHNLDPEEFKVWYHGVGKVNATMFATMACIQHDCEAVINYGTAGALNKELSGQLIQVGLIRQRDMDARPQAELGVTPFEQTDFAGDIRVSNSAWSCSSGDNFVQAPPELESDIVDMESYGIAKVCRHFNKPFICYKYVTDFADENAANEWESNQSNGAGAFLEMCK
jgi:adenosylhomocysteine nucleosidase